MQALDCDLPEGRLLFTLESSRFPITLSDSHLKQWECVVGSCSPSGNTH